MRKITSLLLMLTIAVATVFAERVSREDAALVANNFMNLSSGVGIQKKAPQKRKVMRSVEAQQENLFYVYQSEDGEGWVMIAANDVAHPVLAYSNTGFFRFEGMPANLKEWLSGYNSEISAAEKAGLEQDEEIAAEWSELRRASRQAVAAVVSPLVKTQWDQDHIYSKKCPYDSSVKENTLVGCVATAMAQVMNYHQWPVTGTGKHSYNPLVCVNSNCTKTKQVYPKQEVDFSATTYDWANMKDKYVNCEIVTEGDETYVSCDELSYTTAEGEAVSTLMYHCGVAVDMMYDISDNGGSGAWVIISEGDQSAEYAMKTYFGYKTSLKGREKDDYTDSNWKNMLKTELNASRPLIYSGGAHCFVCDGYDSNDKFHFNWGWSGIDDGYYSLTSLKPTTMWGNGGSDYNFTNYQEAIFGIEPDKPDLADDETTLQYALTGVTMKSGASAGVIKKNTALTATFTANDGYYALADDGNTTVNVTVGGAKDGSYSFSGGVLTVTVPAAKVTDAVAITVTATRDKSKATYYEKVTKAPADWSGQYLIVCEKANVAFDGSLETLDVPNNNILVTINDNLIEETDETRAAEFTIAKSGSSYTIKSASGMYIGKNAASNGLDAKSTVLINTIALDGTDAVITSKGGYVLRFNNATGQKRYRYYNFTQEAVQLYVKPSSIPTSIDEADSAQEQIEAVFNLLGQKVGNDLRSLTEGVYVVKTNMRTYKILFSGK